MDMVDYAQNFIGTPYKWGGQHPSDGYDCSGFVQEVLASKGLDPKGDQTAQALFLDLVQRYTYTPEVIKRNDILFFGDDTNSISHVAIAMDDFRMIEAGGGTSKTRSLAVAIAQQAMVRVRPIYNRRDLVAIIRVID